MHTTKIRLRKPRRVFTFKCDDVKLGRDEACIVETDRGKEWGVCLLPPEPCPDEMGDRFEMSVLRRANPRDEETFQWLVEEEGRAKGICQRKIRERELPMKLVDVEYTFDKRKIIFYFTADDRVDFRELVRDLAHELRARIELRHIQVRDEAKMVGGLGGCGRELCCTTWLDEFKPISMRMAKKQNLSLNPSKISGQCGRLLCCLSYENDQYEAAKRRSKQRQVEQEEAPREEKPRQVEAKEERPSRDKKEGERESRRERGARRGGERRPRRDGQEKKQAQRSEAPQEGGTKDKPEGTKRRRRRRRGRGRGGDKPDSGGQGQGAE